MNRNSIVAISSLCRFRQICEDVGSYLEGLSADTRIPEDIRESFNSVLYEFVNIYRPIERLFQYCVANDLPNYENKSNDNTSDKQ